MGGNMERIERIDMLDFVDDALIDEAGFGELFTAVNDAVAPNITAGVNGRIKAIYAQAGDDVAAVMAEHGCLALLSMDGYMACM